MNLSDQCEKSRFEKEKILLALLPYWDPLIPPLGISCLHSFLKEYGYNVKKIDLNVKNEFSEIYDRYFETLKDCIPDEKRSNFFNIGKNVLRNHMMAHFNYTVESEYTALVRLIIEKIFFCEVSKHQVLPLNTIMVEFYNCLEKIFLDLLEKEKPEVLGLSVFKGTLPASLFVFKITKKHFPRIRTVMGGGVFADQLAPGSPDWEIFMGKTPFIDKIIIGEGELLFLNYLQNKLPDSEKVYILKDIKGETLDINQANIPDFSDLELSYYPSLATYTSRSCPFQCNFCSETVRWGEYRKKDVTQVIYELKTLYEQYHARLFLMSDSLLNPVISDLAKKLIDVKLPVYWDGYLRVDQNVCQSENTLVWRMGGFYRARLGVESGSKRVLELMDKKITPEEIKKALRCLAYSGIKTTTYWIIGYPGETEEDFRQTLSLLEELKSEIYEAEFNAFWYYESGQVKSAEWSQNSRLLFPDSVREMLILQTRFLDLIPPRQETYNRLRRVTEFSRKLGIPNPYSLYDIYKADERWAKLQKNAVPSLLKIQDENQKLDECRNVRNIFTARNTNPLVGDWGL